MPKATLTFNLPEEESEFKSAVKAADYKFALLEFDHYTRNIEKYGTDAQRAAFNASEARRAFWEILTNQEITFEDLNR